MKWFDTQEIKSLDTLSPDQLGYLKTVSFTIFGPLNILIRKRWDFLISIIGIRILDAIVSAESSTASYVLVFIEILFMGWLYYFMIINGRRLAWNRNKWDNFDSFKDSERKWTPWGYIFFALTALIFIGSFLKGFINSQ